MPKTPDSESSHRADDSAPVISSRGLLGLEIQAQIVLRCFQAYVQACWFVHISKTPASESSHHADNLAPVISSRGLLRPQMANVEEVLPELAIVGRPTFSHFCVSADVG